MANGEIWTDEQIEYLTQHYSWENNRDIAKHIGRNYSSIATKAYKLGLHKEIITTSGQSWGKSDISFLIKNYGILTIDKLSDFLKRRSRHQNAL